MFLSSNDIKINILARMWFLMFVPHILNKTKKLISCGFGTYVRSGDGVVMNYTSV